MTPRNLIRRIVRRKPELAFVVLGILIRISMLWRFDVKAGYDASAHWVYVEWFRTHIVRIPLNLTKEAYHPPLYYFIAGMFNRVIPNERWIGAPSVFFACLTIPLLWWGLERHLPGRRIAHAVALALFAVLPASVHLSAMMTAEALNGFLATSALLMAAELLAEGSTLRWVLSVALGLTLGLELLAKVSALVTIGTIGAVAGAALVFTRESWVERLRRAGPWALVLLVTVLTSGWYFERNVELHHKPFLMGFDGTDGPPPAQIMRIPYFRRRPPKFFYGWTDDIYRFPFYPSGVEPRPFLWPVIVASTFSDYYNYGFVRAVDSSTPDAIDVNTRLIPARSIKYAGASVVAGTLIALTTALAWLVSCFVLLRKRDWRRLLFCVAPLFALVGQIHFVVRYPVDGQGPIKGVYLQFACVALAALYGLGVRRLLGERKLRIFGVIEIGAIAVVAIYTFYGRLTW